jgi:MoxR-like ATPase
MSDMITLSVDYGKIPAGTSLEVVKRNKNTTIVTKDGGKRLVVPNTAIAGSVVPEKAKVELTEMQWDAVYTPLLAGKDEDEILEDYVLVTSLKEEIAIKDVGFIKDHIALGSNFLRKGAKVSIPTTTPVGASFSDAERSVLEDLLGGTGDWDAEELSVASDSIEEAVVEEVPELGKDQIFFTDITNGRLPKSGINHIIQQYSSDYFDKDIRHDIPTVDEDHYWDTEVLEALIMGHVCRERCLITGLPGTGKSSSVYQFGGWIRQPYMRLGGRGDMETSSLLGYSWVDSVEQDGDMVSTMAFKPGMLTQGVELGYLVTIDEVMKIPSHIQMCMQHLYEKDGYLTVDDKPGTKKDKIVMPARSFFMILTDNVKGTGDDYDKFAATMMQDTSMLDRIGFTENLEYLEPANERAMLLKKFPSAEKPMVTKLIKFAGLVRNGYKSGQIALTLSPRGLISILTLLSRRMPSIRACEMVYINKIADESEVMAIMDMIRTVGIK